MSSAYMMSFDPLESSVVMRASTMMLNKNGLRTLPWGMPRLCWWHGERCPWMRKRPYLPQRKSLVHLRNLASTPFCARSARITVLSANLKAFSKFGITPWLYRLVRGRVAWQWGVLAPLV